MKTTVKALIRKSAWEAEAFPRPANICQDMQQTVRVWTLERVRRGVRGFAGGVVGALKVDVCRRGF